LGSSSSACRRKGERQAFSLLGGRKEIIESGRRGIESVTTTLEKRGGDSIALHGRGDVGGKGEGEREYILVSAEGEEKERSALTEGKGAGMSHEKRGRCLREFLIEKVLSLGEEAHSCDFQKERRLEAMVERERGSSIEREKRACAWLVKDAFRLMGKGKKGGLTSENPCNQTARRGRHQPRGAAV